MGDAKTAKAISSRHLWAPPAGSKPPRRHLPRLDGMAIPTAAPPDAAGESCRLRRHLPMARLTAAELDRLLAAILQHEHQVQRLRPKLTGRPLPRRRRTAAKADWRQGGLALR